MASSESKPSAGAAPPSERILTLLQLDRVAIVDQLTHVIASFRTAQVAQLVTLLEALESAHELDCVTAYFDCKLDVKAEMERYLQDLLKMHHYITRHSVDTELARHMMQLYGAFGDSGDRQALTKVFQTLGFSLSSVFCVLCERLSPKSQQELLTLFADDLPELRTWVQWLSSVRSSDSKRSHAAADAHDSEAGLDMSATSSAFDGALELVVKTVLERCTLSWLALLRPLPHATRVAVVQEVNRHLPSTSLKQLTRFFDTSGMPLQLYLELDSAVRRAMPTLLNEFPAASLQTLLQKFNSAKRIECVLAGRTLLPKRELLRLVDALGLADTDAIDVFAPALVQYARLEVFTRLFLTFATQQQLHFLNLLREVSTGASLLATASGTAEDGASRATTAADAVGSSSSRGASTSECAAVSCVFDLFLDAHFHSYDAVIQKLATLSSTCAREMVAASAQYTSEELATLGEGIEHIASSCLPQFLSIFAALPLASRKTLVKWVREVPGDDALPVYDVVLSHLARTTEADAAPGGTDIAVKVLELLSTLAPKDKRALCTAVLVRVSPLLDHQQLRDATAIAEMRGAQANALALNDSVLRYLCDCTMAVHKAVKLFRGIPAAQFDSLIFLLRTQRLAEQVALARLMLSLPSDANCRLLAKVQGLITTETLDLFFELLLLIPQVEYRSFAKLLISPNVSSEQLQRFVQVAASLMNQASSRELVIFAAALPVVSRNLFFDMLAHDPVKGVLLRIVARSSKLAPELLHALIALLHPLSWGTRSSFIEQIRALESTQDIQDVLDVARELTPDDLEILALFFNVLQVPVRICFASLFLPLARQEKHLALAKLNALPKAQLQSFCATVCDSVHCVVGTAFFRVFGLLESPYQLTLLALLQFESCWPLVSLMADCVARSPEPSLINGFAASLVLLSHESEFVLLRCVVEEALASDTSLHALVLVLCHFRSRAEVLELLKYVQHLSRFVRSTAFFRVLSQYKQTAFLFAVCRMLDLDDALFALKRLDQLRPQHRGALERELDALANRSANVSVEIKSEFCNVVLGFHERSVSLGAAESGSVEQLQADKLRCIVPRTVNEVAASTGALMLSSLLDATEDTSDQTLGEVLFVPSTRPLSHPPLSLERYLRRVQSNGTFAQRRSPTVASRPSELDHEATATIDEIAQCEPTIVSRDDADAGPTAHAQLMTETQSTGGQSTPSSAFALPDVAHVMRDRGASIFRKECEAASDENRACRIRVSKTLAAQSHVMAVRVQHALGKRDVYQSTDRSKSIKASETSTRVVMDRDDSAQLPALLTQSVADCARHDSDSMRVFPPPSASALTSAQAALAPPQHASERLSLVRPLRESLDVWLAALHTAREALGAAGYPVPADDLLDLVALMDDYRDGTLARIVSASTLSLLDRVAAELQSEARADAQVAAHPRAFSDANWLPDIAAVAVRREAIRSELPRKRKRARRPSAAAPDDRS